jgi:GntR family transcriptional regulator, transcriptional repressor for pyruvate dehydrogenase complex
MEEVNQELAAAKTLDQRIDADMRFHTLLAEATGNPVFGLLLEPLTHLLRLSLKETLGRVGSDRAVHGHQQIIEAVRQRNPEGARLAILGLVDMAEQDLGIG